ncbi:hypothetical protein T03_5667 [Trichinella britovi]|uniref:Uncharacterized protein n=1 Tax=Trichinella britovi TaxID=45882 RepID=A0A0V1DBC6_TRIBR|nr:hypothetical protein T03_5667 [Trichinella britovi]
MVRPDGTIPSSEFVMELLIKASELSSKCRFPPPGFILIAGLHELQHQPAVEYEQLAVSTDNFMKYEEEFFHDLHNRKQYLLRDIRLVLLTMKFNAKRKCKLKNGTYSTAISTRLS